MKTKLIISLTLLSALITTLIIGSFGFALVLAVSSFLAILPIPKNDEKRIDPAIGELNSMVYTQTGN